MGVILDDLWHHEGYGARRSRTGRSLGTWSAATASSDTYVASCGCSWHGADHPPTEEGYEASVAEWEALHAHPVLAPTAPEELRSKIRDVQQEMSALVSDHLLAGVSTLRSLTTWVSATLARAQAALGPHHNRHQPRATRAGAARSVARPVATLGPPPATGRPRRPVGLETPT